MDWIRRNWPDLLIGIALVAVIAGIIATLLTGGSFFPLGASQASSSRPEQSSTPVVEREPTSTAVTSSSSSTSGEPSESVTAGTPAEPVVATEEPDAVAEAAEPVSVSALPLPGSGSNESTAANPSVDQPSQRPSAGTASQQTSVLGSGLPRADEGGTYRISVGAFSSEENAQKQAATFREADYPVFIGTQGDLSIVLVGPYDDLAEAERVAERIRAGGFRIEPVIYRFQADSEAESSGSVPASRATSPTPQPSAAQATAGQFLQVGAYGTRESSLPQRERLESLGFRVSERVESGLVKLLVGPFAGDDMSEARVLLSEQGIDHFPR